MGLNRSGLRIAKELDINKDDARAMIGQRGREARRREAGADRDPSRQRVAANREEHTGRALSLIHI